MGQPLMSWAIRAYDEVGGLAGRSRRGYVVWGETMRLTHRLRIVGLALAGAAAGGAWPAALLAQVLTGAQAPVVGFSPLVAISTSNRRIGGEFNFEHTLQPNGYVGTALTGQGDSNYVIGVLDSGSVADIFEGQAAAQLGITGQWVTGNTTPLGGPAGFVDGPVTERLGVFAQGLGAIQPDGKLDLAALKGHTNVSGVIIPQGAGVEFTLPSIIGTPLMAFYDSVIRSDLTRSVVVDGERRFSPDVQIVNPGQAPTLAHRIAIEFGGPLAGLATTAAYYPDILNLDFEVPYRPTVVDITGGSLLSGGGLFFGNVGVVEGEPGPLNPIQNLRLMVDTGAQGSIISEGVAANLSLDLNNPDFTIDVGGIGGIIEDVPGFYIDFMRINASGGALDFVQAPFLVRDLPSPEGGTLDGILGMNFFWDRNVVFKPSLTGTGFFEVSAPVVFKGDLDGDGMVDAFDVAKFELALADLEAFHAQNPNVNPILVGDIDGMGEFDAFDVARFEALLAAAGGSVPEPAALWIIAAGGAALAARRRRRRSRPVV